MWPICSVLCLQAKFYDHPFIELSGGLRAQLEKEAKKMRTKLALSTQEENLIDNLYRVFNILHEKNSMRKSLIKFRNELELWKMDGNLVEHRLKMIELTIELLSLLHYSTLFCTKLKSIEQRYEDFKRSGKDFKSNYHFKLDKLDKLYLSVLFKMPKLMFVKRGFIDALRQTGHKENERPKIDDNLQQTVETSQN